MTEQSDGAPADESRSAVEEAAGSPSPPALVGESEAAALRAIARWIGLGTVGYVVIAAALAVLSLRRGRLFDAILVVLTLLLTTPVILGYRKQAIRRARDAGRDPGAEDPPPPGSAS